MKRLIAILLSAGLLVGSGMASADRYHHGRHYPGRHHSHHYYAPNLGYLAGGLLIGSILADSYHRARTPDVYYIERRAYPPPRVIYRDYTVVPRGPALDRYLLRDLDGNCFEMSTDEEGSELRAQVPAAECDW